ERKIFFAPGDDIGETIYPKPQENIVSVKLKTGLTEAVIGSATVQGEEFWASVEKGETEIDIPLWFFKEGNNGISLKIYDDGDSLLASKETSIAINDKPVWLDCDLGLDDEVPAPWTPVEINNNKINVWGREYDFQKSIFPEKILSQNKDILASPIYFEADGKVLSVSAPAVKERKKSSVVLESEIGGLKGKAETLCEFDGLLKFDVTFEPGKTKNLTLNIPLNKEIAKNYDNYAYTFGGGPGFIMPTEKDMAGKLTVPYSKQFMPVIWVGDPARGMAFLCEGMENWNLSNTDRAYEIVEENGAYVLKVHFMDTETSWDRPIKLTFGLNVTPVKPLPRDNDWLTFRPVTMTGERLFFTCWGGATRWQGFPVVGNCKANPGDPDEFDDRDFKKHITELRERKLNLPAYLTPSALVTDIPDLVYHRDEWKSVPEVVTGTDTGQSIVLTCLKDKGLQDCYIYYLNEFMNKYDVDAIYMDFSHCQRCSNPAHGCGYEKDGKREPAWPLFAYHDMHKRIYKVMQKCKPDAPFRVIGHCSGGKVLPHINFWDATVDGEYINVDIRGPKYNSDYTAFYSMDRFATEYTAKGWGSLPLFMAYVTSPKDTETMFAYALQAGAVVWPAYMDYRTQSDIWTALDSFGVDCITDFLPYWENGGAVSWDNKNVYVGTYRNSKGKVLFAISNLEAEPEDINVKINREKLGLGDYALKDMRTGEAVSGDGDSFSVTVPDKGFRLIQAE
ncbi:MAG: hypothetical protein KBT47_05055, partial [Armatimonadetes bacterium]|nr:hypothetical protein [Candidatus Hippobium faecium]